MSAERVRLEGFQLGPRGRLFFATASALLGLGLLIASVVTWIHLSDRAGATTAAVMGCLFLLGAWAIYYLCDPLVLEFDEAGLAIDGGADPVARAKVGGRHVTIPWSNVEAVRLSLVMNHQLGWVFSVRIETGRGPYRRLIRIGPFPAQATDVRLAHDALLAQMKAAAAAGQPNNRIAWEDRIGWLERWWLSKGRPGRND
jgi:hypothetical protein